MSDSNITTVQEIYDAFGRGDVDAILDHLADDVDWSSEADDAIAPWHGRRTSKADVPTFFEGIAEALEVTEFTPLAFAGSDTDVMAIIRFGFSVRATGKSGTMNIHHWWRLRDGKVVQYRGSEDTALVARTLEKEAVGAP